MFKTTISLCSVFIASSALAWTISPWKSRFYSKEQLRLENKKALIITTSQKTLDPTDKATGVWASEMTEPYYTFVDAGMSVDIASIAGGDVPIDPFSIKRIVRSQTDIRYLKDQVFLNKSKHSIPIGQVKASDYDIIFLAGGWGAAYDFGQSKTLGKLMTKAIALGKVIGAVCHGPLGLLQAIKSDGKPLLRGLKVTAVTDRQVRQLGIDITPLHPEQEMKKAGARYESKRSFTFDFFSHHVVQDGDVITGQNQRAGAEVAYRAMKRFVDRDKGWGLGWGLRWGLG